MAELTIATKQTEKELVIENEGLSKICQEKCPVQGCHGKCINDEGHPVGRHYCDLGSHSW